MEHLFFVLSVTACRSPVESFPRNRRVEDQTTHQSGEFGRVPTECYIELHPKAALLAEKPTAVPGKALGAK